MADPLESIVADAQARSAEVRRNFAHLLPPASEPWHPIPFFGPLTEARALTVAMNPSADEFRGRSWPHVLGAPQLTTRLRTYFTGAPAPAHPWFDAAGRALLPIGLRYGGDLAHVDVVCRATRTIGRGDGHDFLSLASQEDELFFRSLESAGNAKLAVLTGSLTGRYYLHEYVARRGPVFGWHLSPKPRRVPGGPFSAFHTLTKAGRRIHVFFTSASANRRGGPAEYERLLLAGRDALRAAVA